MTIKQAKAAARELGCSLRCIDGEFRVNYRFGSEATAYYTADLEDALDMARAIARSRKARAEQ